VVSQSVRRARTLRIHTGDETASAHRPRWFSPRWFRGDSPETRARPALTVDSTPLLEMRKKNLTRPTVFTLRDNSLVSFICRSRHPPPRQHRLLLPAACVEVPLTKALAAALNAMREATRDLPRADAVRACSLLGASSRRSESTDIAHDLARAWLRRASGSESGIACTTDAPCHVAGGTRRLASLPRGFLVASSAHASFLWCPRGAIRETLPARPRVLGAGGSCIGSQRARRPPGWVHPHARDARRICAAAPSGSSRCRRSALLTAARSSLELLVATYPAVAWRASAARGRFLGVEWRVPSLCPGRAVRLGRPSGASQTGRQHGRLRIEHLAGR
jgi:hypothetical protein